MAISESFVFYESFLKNAQHIEKAFGKEKAYDFLISLIEYGCYGLTPDEDDIVWAMGFEQTIAAINAAKQRYNRAVANGHKGGRPKKEIQVEDILKLRNNRYTIEEIAAELGIGTATVKRRLSENNRGKSSDE